MAKTRAAAEPDQEPPITVLLANHQRTSLGDFTTPLVELPADEARELIRSGLATRVQVAA